MSSPSMHGSIAPALELLASREGRYKGRGKNADGAEFSAEMEIASRVSGAVIEIRFKATDDESGFHDELTWITPDLRNDHLCLWTVSTNTPGVLCHPLVEDLSDDVRERRFVFRLGEPAKTTTFRQEILLDLRLDGSIEYRYSWGVPHGNFAVRVQSFLMLT